jgi:hypothetical protein
MNYFEATDPDLTKLVKDNNDEEALSLLINRHSGIYADMVKRYGSKSLSINEINDIMNEKDYIIYKAALEYKEEKAKFSTHVGNKAKYICLSKKTYNKKRKKNIPFESIEYSKESSELHPDENCQLSEEFLEILDLINDHKDDRVSFIFKERYFGGERGKLKTWKKIANQINLSAQGCINIHDRTLAEFQNKIKKNA